MISLLIETAMYPLLLLVSTFAAHRLGVIQSV